MGVAEAGRHHAAGQIIHRLIGECCRLAVEQRHVDRLAFAGVRLMDERRLDGDGRVEAGDKIGDGDAHFHGFGARRSVGLAGDAHQSAHALDEIIVAGFVLVRTVMAEARERAIDEARILCGEGFVIEAVTGERAGLEVLDDDMGAARQPFDEGRTFGLREIDGDGSLVAIGGEEIGRVAASQRNGGPKARVSSPSPGFSIFRISAPRSPRICVAHGPASTRLKSRTRICDSAPMANAPEMPARS